MQAKEASLRAEPWDLQVDKLYGTKQGQGFREKDVLQMDSWCGFVRQVMPRNHLIFSSLVSLVQRFLTPW